MESGKDMCRACLTTEETFTNFIHQNVSKDLFWFCTSIEIQVPPDDTISKAICNACHELLLQFAEFKHMCIQSNNTLTCIKDGLKRDAVKEFDACDRLLQSIDVAVKVEHETSELSQDDFLEADHISDDFIKKSGQKLKKKSYVKPKIKKSPFCFSCENCDKKFVDADRYEGHMLMHMGKTVKIQCLPCNKMFRTWYSLSRHKRNVHTVVSLERLRCSLCGKVSKNEQTLQMHRRRHAARDAVMCDVCGRLFNSHTILKVHLQTHEESRPRPYTCQQCGGKFHSQSSLRAHARSHGAHRFVCEHCARPFRDKFSLLKHILRHEGRKMYECGLCGKSFAAGSSLAEHKRLHSGEKPYPCPECNKRFTTRRMLVEHQRTHTGEKPHKCALCTHAFTQRGTLKRHMKVHDKPAPAHLAVSAFNVPETAVS